MPGPARSYSLGAYDEATRSVPVIASTRNPVKGWETNADGTQTPRLESLASWDLRRFAKNPVILWQHNGSCSAIGLASDVQETERGLEMRINFASAHDEPMAEEAIKRLKAGLVRGVSVGFDFGPERTDEVIDGRKVAVFRGNVLNEASLVTIPADEDALAGEDPTGVLADEEQKKLRASNAGRELVKHRQARTDSDDTEEVTRFDAVRFGSARRNDIGGLIIQARVARTGILKYRLPDGSVRREYRPEEECFRADSLKTLEAAPVTDWAHHKGLLDTSNYRGAVLGVLREVRQDGQYVAGEIHLNDANSIAAVESGRLADCSAGYRCRLERKSGVYKGEPYDAIQRGITYNHVAVLPPGVGRAGADVGLRLDSSDAVCVEEIEPMPETKTLIKLDGKDIEYGSEAHIEHLEKRCDAAEQDRDAKVAAANKERDEAQARCDAAKKEKADMEAEAEKERKERAAKAKAARALRRAARDVIRKFEDAEDAAEDEEEKTDALEDELDGLNDREVMVRAIRADSKDFDDKGRSDDYVAARFDSVVESAKKHVRTDGVDSVAHVANHHKRKLAPAGNDAVSKARAALEKETNEAWKRPLTVTKE